MNAIASLVRGGSKTPLAILFCIVLAINTKYGFIPPDLMPTLEWFAAAFGLLAIGHRLEKTRAAATAAAELGESAKDVLRQVREAWQEIRELEDGTLPTAEGRSP